MHHHSWLTHGFVFEIILSKKRRNVPSRNSFMPFPSTAFEVSGSKFFFPARGRTSSRKWPSAASGSAEDIPQILSEQKEYCILSKKCEGKREDWYMSHRHVTTMEYLKHPLIKRKLTGWRFKSKVWQPHSFEPLARTEHRGEPVLELLSWSSARKGMRQVHKIPFKEVSPMT